MYYVLYVLNPLNVIRFQLQSCINYIWFDRSCMFNTLLNDNVLPNIRIKFIIRIIRNTRIKQLNRLLPKCNDRNKTKTTFFTRKIDQFHPKTGQFRHFFEVKNVVNFSNSSRQYSVKIVYSFVVTYEIVMFVLEQLNTVIEKYYPSSLKSLN